MTLKGGQMYLDDMFSMSKDDTVDIDGPSEIASFFTNRKILVTGGSGFLGLLLVEKLLRSCPNIAVLYLFMRAKKGKTSVERYKEYFNNIIFHRLKIEQPNFKEKVLMIEGDASEINLGLSPDNRERLKDTEIIFHAAATVRFDETLRTAVKINVRGTKELLLFAKEMPNLKGFIHISTAFSHCLRKFIDETFYEPPKTPDNILKLMDILNDDELVLLTPHLIKQWPNTYIYTKAIGEEVIRQYSNGIPTCIVRPSIMVATAHEPVPGWINNIYGPTGVVIGSSYGVLRTLHCKQESVADLIPADIVINNIIAAAWNTAQKRKNQQNVTDANENKCTIAEEIPIYNSVSCVQNEITWAKFMELVLKNGLDIPSIKMMWYYMIILNRYKFVDTICQYFLHLLPAIIVDTILFVIGRKPLLWKTYKRVHKFSAVISYFSTQQWRFKNDRVISLWNKMSPVDKRIFLFSMENHDWDDYFYHYMLGLRQYIAKDPLETLEIGRLRYKKLKVAHYTLMTLLSLLLLWGLYSLFYASYTWLYLS